MIDNLLKTSLLSSFIRTLLFATVHVGIDLGTIIAMTELSIAEALPVSIIEPLLNCVWFFIFDRTWTLLLSKRNTPKQHPIKKPPTFDMENV